MRKHNVFPYPLTIAGFMSGTSLDGVDVAVITTDGQTLFERGEYITLPYPTDFQARLKNILGSSHITPEIVAVTHELMDYHIKAYQALKKVNSIDMLAIHGQTIFHAPSAPTSFTWQIIDPEYLYGMVGKPIIYDFRSDDIKNGGEGAPLVPIYHLSLAQTMEKPLIFLNIGGVSNITGIVSNSEANLIAGDTGPGNALINDYVSQHFGVFYDEGGAIAFRGKADANLVEIWLRHPFFDRPFPKSLDRDTFQPLLRDLDAYKPEDAVATLTEFTVQAITRFLPFEPQQLITCGGGQHNHFIMKRLREELSCPVYTSEDKGLNTDALEAEAFAFLGARRFFNLPLSFPKTTGVAFPTCGGRIFSK